MHEHTRSTNKAEVERGAPWRFREPDTPNPLTIQVTGWSSGKTRLGPAEFMNGVDRDGKTWSVLVGPVVLRKRLIEGIVDDWDNVRREFVVGETLGRVQPSEVVEIQYLGDAQGQRYKYPTFTVSRNQPPLVDDQIPF